jgi:hypothetical protein
VAEIFLLPVVRLIDTTPLEEIQKGQFLKVFKESQQSTGNVPMTEVRNRAMNLDH